MVRGDQRGRELGYPTANVPTSGMAAAPADGVYAGWLRRLDTGDRYPAAISVGTNPTFEGERERRVESYVLDRDDLELYDVEVEVAFVDRIRGMVRFDGVDALVETMQQDVVRAHGILDAPDPVSERRPVVDLTDEEARRALVLKWGTVRRRDPGLGRRDGLRARPRGRRGGAEGRARRCGRLPAARTPIELSEAYAGFAARHFGSRVEPDWMIPVVDVTAGVRFVIDTAVRRRAGRLPGAGLLTAVRDRCHDRPCAGRPRRRRRSRARRDRPGPARRRFAAGARTLILTQPHNPWGRVFGRSELEGIRDVVVRYGARVVSDEIHAPLVLPGAVHTSYLDLEGTHDHAVAVVAASKAFNTAGLRCAQLWSRTRRPSPAAAAPMARNDSWSPLGWWRRSRPIATVIPGCVAGRTARPARTLLGDLLAEHLPDVRMRPLEATYLAWLDARAYGHDDPAAVALERGLVSSLRATTTCRD